MVACLAVSLISCNNKKMEISETSRNQTEQEVQQAFKSLVASAEAIDIKGYFEHFDTEKFVGLNADGTNWNSIEEFSVLIEPWFNAMQRSEYLKFTNVQVSVIDSNTAVLVNEFEQRVLLKDGTYINSAGGGTQVWSKASGKWLLVSVSASSKS